MPQVHNKSLSYDTAAAFGKNSRYMASLKFTEESLRRVNVLNTLENRITKKKVDFYDRNIELQTMKFERVKQRLVDNYHKRLAYKLVLKNHSITNAKNYQKALDQKYTFVSLHHEVKQMMSYMRPDKIRERKARALIHESQNAYDNIVFKNSQAFNKLFPEKKTWMSRRYREMLEKQKEEEAKAKEPTPLPTRERQAKKSLATLRRRIISLDDSKPNSPQKLPKTPALSPIKTPTISKPPSSNSRMAKRQEISMSMMKKQKSFIEGREMTKDDIITTMESKMKELSVECETSDKENKNNKDINNNEIVEVTKSDSQGDSVVNSVEKKESFLPPIEQTPRTPKSTAIPVQSQRDKPVKLPALKMSKAVKVH